VLSVFRSQSTPEQLQSRRNFAARLELFPLQEPALDQSLGDIEDGGRHGACRSATDPAAVAAYLCRENTARAATRITCRF
jgi:hypothetical protein